MKAKRVIAIALSMIMMISLLNLNAFAAEPPLPMPRAATDIFYTPVMTAGILWSGYNSNHIYSLVCNNKTSLKGSDVDLYIYYTGVGMPSTFAEDCTRIVTVDVMEDDAGWGNDNEELFTRIGYFGKEDGLYMPIEWATRSNVNTNIIEDNNTLELYIRVMVETKENDRTSQIPKELLGYNFVTTY